MDKTKSMFVTGTRLRAKMDHCDQMEIRSSKGDVFLNECILFYNATIKPLFLYGGAVWSVTSKANVRRVFRLQKSKE